MEIKRQGRPSRLSLADRLRHFPRPRAPGFAMVASAALILSLNLSAVPAQVLNCPAFDAPQSSNDYDGDGLSDADEVFVYLTHPCMSDTDQDGLNDGR